MKKRNESVFDVAAHRRQLKNAHDALVRLHKRKGKPNPSRMSADQFGREWTLLDRLSGTVYLTGRLQARWEAMSRENSSRATAAFSSLF